MNDRKMNALIVHAGDDVVTVVEPIHTGDVICWQDIEGIHEITAIEDIPKFHKAATRDLKVGESVMKYGESIGRVVRECHAGAWVHTHNLSDFPEED